MANTDLLNTPLLWINKYLQSKLSEDLGYVTPFFPPSPFNLDDLTEKWMILNNVNTPTTEVYTFRSNNADPNTAVTSTLTIKSSYKAVYVYNHETEVNDNKRQIKLLKQSYIQPLINELGTVLNG